jgi:hypothetical protein
MVTGAFTIFARDLEVCIGPWGVPIHPATAMSELAAWPLCNFHKVFFVAR